ncbi:hypothetical protein BGZ81_004977, partial [Podila clonocystis]
YTAYMTETGPCIGKCSAEEQALYNAQYQAKNAWYTSKKAALAGNGTTTTTTASGPTPSATGAASILKMSGLVGAAAVMSAVILF